MKRFSKSSKKTKKTDPAEPFSAQERERLLLKIQELERSLHRITHSTTWKLASRYFRLRDGIPAIAYTNTQLKKWLRILERLLRRKAKASPRSLRTVLFNIRKDIRDHRHLQRILEQHKGKPIVVFRPTVDWNIPLFQRPQHIALNLAKKGILYFYSTGNYKYDQIDGFDEVAEGCFVTNRYDLVSELSPNILHHLYSTDNQTGPEFVSEELVRGNRILYEYVDEIHDQVSCIAIPQATYDRHRLILQDERCLVVATADKLLREVQAERQKNFAFACNGVDYAHFIQSFGPKDVPKEMQTVVQSGKPIIGYYGALASWFDFDLIKHTAKQRPDWEIVLIGWDYDGSLAKAKLDRFPNIHVFGPIEYKLLPSYACWFHVATIPFLVNDITESTSPIKLFEYMALGKPIVTTDMPECRKYRSVRIATGAHDFVRKAEAALANMTQPSQLRLLRQEALENTWDKKAEVISRLLGGIIE